MTIKNAKDLVAEANAFVDALSADAALKLLAKKDAVFVNLREKDELEKSGNLKGAVHVPRGLLEFQADHASPSRVQAFDPAKHLVLFCGSGSRSALAARTLRDMGFERVSHVTSGFPAIKKAGGHTEGGA